MPAQPSVPGGLAVSHLAIVLEALAELFGSFISSSPTTTLRDLSVEEMLLNVFCGFVLLHVSLICQGAFLVLRDGLCQPCSVKQTVGQRADAGKVTAIALGRSSSVSLVPAGPSEH